MKRKTIEQLYFEFLEDGLDSFEIDKRINTILFYRSMDEVSPSEALIRQSIRIENLAETGYYDMDILDEGDIQLHSDVQESLDNLPEYASLAEQLREMKSQLNDLLIDKHLYNVIVKHNINEDNNDSDDDSQDKDKDKKEKGD